MKWVKKNKGCFFHFEKTSNVMKTVKKVLDFMIENVSRQIF